MQSRPCLALRSGFLLLAALLLLPLVAIVHSYGHISWPLSFET
jgi:uncharacterized membrane protein